MAAKVGVQTWNETETSKVCFHDPTTQIPNVDEKSLLIDDHTTEVFFWVVTSLLCGIVSLFGITTNGINIAVFVSLGFTDTINISLLALAISDLLSLVTLLWTAICHNPEFQAANLPFIPTHVTHLLGGLPHSFFVLISGWIVAFVAFERFLCIAYPLKVKTISTLVDFRPFVVTICTLVALSAVPIYSSKHLGWVFVSERNRSLLALVFTENMHDIESITFSFFIASTSTTFGLVSIFTALIVGKLKERSRLRAAMLASSEATEDNVTTRDQRLARMMVIVSTIFIVCMTPTMVFIIIMIFVPEFSIAGDYRNIFNVAVSCSYLLEGVNSSLNFFAYYHMSSRYNERLGLICTTRPRLK